MEVFFVRHGETDGNQVKRHQFSHISLNEKGKKQALAVADRLKEIKPTHLYTSSFKRAEETAGFIKQATGLKVVSMPMFAEVIRPEYIRGESHFGFKSFFYMMAWYFSLQNETIRKGGGETYNDFIQTVDKAVDWCQKFATDDRLVIVSHSVFINFFLMQVIYGELKWWQTPRRFFTILRLKNTAIVHLSFKSKDEYSAFGDWKFIGTDTEHIST